MGYNLSKTISIDDWKYLNKQNSFDEIYSDYFSIYFLRLFILNWLLYL